MKKRFKNVAVIIFVLISAWPALTNAQNSAIINDSLYSKILNEERSVKVILPDTYKPGSDEKFEVIYLTDGEWVSDLFPFIYNFAKKEDYVPPVIIVALPNTYLNKVNQRDRDFLPVHVENPAISGGADKFISFLKSELIPFIENKYPTNGTRSLYGHSYGGLFTMYTLLTEPTLFSTYYSTDPSFWWNNDFVIKLAAERLEKIPAGRLLWIAGIDETYKGMGIERMDTVLKHKAPKSLTWKIATFPNEKHNSVRLKAMYDGIKFSYSGYMGTEVEFHPMNGIALKDKPFPVFFLNRYPNLRYSTDGTEPTANSPKGESQIILNNPGTLIVKSFSVSGKYDKTAKGIFTSGEVLTPITSQKKVTNGGLKYSLYSGNWEKFPDFKTLKAEKSGIADTLFNIKELKSKNSMACMFEGYIKITDEGYYLFATRTKNASRLYLGGKLLFEENNVHPAEKITSYIVPLTKGLYPVRLEYFQKDGDADLQLVYLKPGAQSPIPIPFKDLSR
jgi:predicted alpha/beta superfamily hydrolase